VPCVTPCGTGAGVDTKHRHSATTSVRVRCADADPIIPIPLPGLPHQLTPVKTKQNILICTVDRSEVGRFIRGQPNDRPQGRSINQGSVGRSRFCRSIRGISNCQGSVDQSGVGRSIREVDQSIGGRLIDQIRDQSIDQGPVDRSGEDSDRSEVGRSIRGRSIDRSIEGWYINQGSISRSGVGRSITDESE